MPGVGLGILIFNEEDEVLLILRNSDPSLADSDMHLEGTWTLPAGKIKKGETIFGAAKRKAKEEVNLDIENLSIVSIADDINEYDHFVTFGILASSYDGEVNLGTTKEHVEYKFTKLNELPDNLCMPSKNIINNYLKNRLYKEEIHE